MSTFRQFALIFYSFTVKVNPVKEQFKCQTMTKRAEALKPNLGPLMQNRKMHMPNGRKTIQEADHIVGGLKKQDKK